MTTWRYCDVIDHSFAFPWSITWIDSWKKQNCLVDVLHPYRGTYDLSFEGSANIFRPKLKSLRLFYCWPFTVGPMSLSKKPKPCIYFWSLSGVHNVWWSLGKYGRRWQDVGKFAHPPLPSLRKCQRPRGGFAWMLHWVTFPISKTAFLGQANFLWSLTLSWGEGGR